VSTAAISAARLERRARLLAWSTVAWNVIEAVVAIGAGAVASSIALISFGLDSTVEVFSALVILWQFHGMAHEREARARKLISPSASSSWPPTSPSKPSSIWSPSTSPPRHRSA
jgi:hypothetical protein